MLMHNGNVPSMNLEELYQTFLNLAKPEVTHSNSNVLSTRCADLGFKSIAVPLAIALAR